MRGCGEEEKYEDAKQVLLIPPILLVSLSTAVLIRVTGSRSFILGGYHIADSSKPFVGVRKLFMFDHSKYAKSYCINFDFYIIILYLPRPIKSITFLSLKNCNCCLIFALILLFNGCFVFK